MIFVYPFFNGKIELTSLLTVVSFKTFYFGNLNFSVLCFGNEEKVSKGTGRQASEFYFGSKQASQQARKQVSFILPVR